MDVIVALDFLTCNVFCCKIVGARQPAHQIHTSSVTPLHVLINIILYYPCF